MELGSLLHLPDFRLKLCFHPCWNLLSRLRCRLVWLHIEQVTHVIWLGIAPKHPAMHICPLKITRLLVVLGAEGYPPDVVQVVQGLNCVRLGLLMKLGHLYTKAFFTEMD